MNIGTDILYIPRLEKIINTNPYFIKKVYTKNEIEIANKLKNPIYFYATRFAGKEAVMKATKGMYDFKEIEILKNKDGSPKVNIINSEIEVDISLSYDNDYAIAYVIAKN